MIVDKPKKRRKFSRYNVFLIIMGVVFSFIIIKLMYLQIYKNDDYKDKANTTSTRFIAENAPRGKIYDNKGNILATSEQTYSVTYTTTDEASKSFYNTVDKMSEILNENGERFNDEFILNLDEGDNWYFNYKTSEELSRKSEEIRFKRDRGLGDVVEKKLFKNKDDQEELNEKEMEQVNNELLKITPDDVFDYLVKTYGLVELINPKPDINSSKDILDEYEIKKEKYSKMNEEEIGEILLDTYSKENLRRYLVVKDALNIQGLKGFKSVTIAKNIKKDTAFIILQQLNDLPGIDVVNDTVRKYPYDNLASTVIGYLSKIDESKKNAYEMRGYDVSTDLIGVSGIESALEEQLKGVKGGTTVKVNSKGRVTQELFKLESYPGNNVHLTIDKDIQSATESALIGTMEELRTSGGYPNANRGAAVVTEAKTGRILALVSYPNYNPNDFVATGGLDNDKMKEYFSPDLESFGQEYIVSNRLNTTVEELFPKDSITGVREDKRDVYPRPLYNYATLGLIQPGSTFKPMTGIAALESNVININDTVNCTQHFNIHNKELYGENFKASCLGYHGQSDIKKALEVSCNFYFYEMAYRLYMNGGKNIAALDEIAKYAWQFGLGTDPDGKENPSTGIEIEENFGQVYNFKSFKSRQISGFKLTLAEELEKGVCGGQTFIPLDYSYSDDDSEKLREAKTSLKDKITDAFNRVGTSDSITNGDEFAKRIVDDIKNIMNLSDKYKENVMNAEEQGKKVDRDREANAIAHAIKQFVIYDKPGEIISPAQEVYAAIGQGMNNFTPLQLAQYVSTIATGGERYKFHLVDKVTNTDGDVVQEFKPEILNKVNISESTLSAIKDGMAKVTMDDNGTSVRAWDGFKEYINVAGKTGTADSSDHQEEYGRAPYATYVGFAPVDNPEIVISVVVYDGGHGGNIAKVARAAFEAYFKDRLIEMNPNYGLTSETYQKYVMTVPTDNKDN